MWIGHSAKSPIPKGHFPYLEGQTPAISPYQNTAVDLHDEINLQKYKTVRQVKWDVREMKIEICQQEMSVFVNSSHFM